MLEFKINSVNQQSFLRKQGMITFIPGIVAKEKKVMLERQLTKMRNFEENYLQKSLIKIGRC